MQPKRGFTLLEIIIALALSSFIVIALGRALRHAAHFFSRGKQQMGVLNTAGYAMQQLERDLAAAFILVLEEKQTARLKENIQQKKLQKKKKEKNFFLARSDRDNVRRVGEKKFEFFKNLNFITTNPLMYYEEIKPKLVRVAYMLVRKKIKGQPDLESYKLIRKETADLANEKFERKELSRKERWRAISRYVIADNVKELFIEYIPVEAFDKNQKKSDQKRKPLFNWGQTKQTKNVLPSCAKVHLTLWDDIFSREWRYETLVPFLAKGKLEKPQQKIPVKGKKKQQTQKGKPQAGDVKRR